VSQDRHRDPRVDVEVGEDRAAGSPAVVDSDAGYASLGDAAVPDTVEVSRFDGGPVLGLNSRCEPCQVVPAARLSRSRSARRS
jgi:hypothetical protein